MKKKLLALLCVLSILVGVFAVVAKAEATAEDKTVRVGYAKVDINPYYRDAAGNLTDANGNPLAEGADGVIMPLPLRGYGSSYSRLANGRIDDNGNGELDDGDGLFATCIAVTDSQKNTVLLITMDTIGNMGHATEAKQAICSALNANKDYKQYAVTQDRILISGTHTHGGVDLEADTTKLDEENVELLAKWKTDMINRLVEAALSAMGNRADATLKKGAIAAEDATNPKVMNSVRHYLCDEGFVFSDNSNPEGTNPQAVSQVDTNLQMVSFEFADKVANPTIVLANWRCHPSLNSGDNRNAITSDYVNAFRYKMEEAGYRPAFFQGAGGNNNPTSKVGDAGAWIVGDAKSNLKGNTYGYALAVLALKGLTGVNATGDAYMNAVEGGLISSNQEKYKANRLKYTEDSIEYKAAQAAIEANKTNNWWEEYLPDYWDGKNTDPYVYKDKNTNEVYCIASLSHANTIIGSVDASDKITMEINAVMIGEHIAIVTTPGESFDRYSSEATLSTANDFNDWDNLYDESYGTPLIFGYTNLHVGYIPNALSYTYNAGSTKYAQGSYETQISKLQPGAGEEMVSRLDNMLESMTNAVREAKCEYCGEVVEWYPKNSGTATEHGHYYLTENVDGVAQTKLSAATTVCLDLNDYTMTCTNRAFEAVSGAGATLNIMDTSENKTGKLVGTGAGMSGGTIYLDQGNTLNIYSGTITCNTEDQPVQKGGVIWTKGKEINVYGGTIDGCYAIGKGGAIFSEYGTINIYDGEICGGETDLNGGAVCLNSSNCTLKVYGGRITAGTAEGNGDCVAVDYGHVVLGGDAQVDEIRYADIPTNTKPTFNIKSSKTDAVVPFTGKVTLNIPAITDYTKPIGKSTVEWGAGSKVTIADGTEVYMTENLDIVTQAPFTKDDKNVIRDAVVCTNDSISYPDSLEEAISNAAQQGYVVLGKDVTEPLTVKQNVTIDLNGKNIDKLNVAEGVVVQIRDRQTDDFFVGDHVYGVIKTVTGKGKVVGAENYLVIKDAETKSLSAHHYIAEINEVVLRSSKAGMYYKSEFKGSDLVKENIATFGVAVSLDGEPTKDTLRPDNHSAFAAEKFGEEGTSTILANIMRTIYDDDAYNNTCAEMPVHGSAYVKLKDGTYRFSRCQTKSLKETVQDLDKQYAWNETENTEKKVLTDPQKKELMDMYNRFSSVMDDWNIGVINDALAEEDETLKVIILGSSYSKDSFWLLPEVIKAQGIPENFKFNDKEIKKVELAVLYYSGCRVRQHVEFAKSGAAEYIYYTNSYQVGADTTGPWKAPTDKEGKTVKVTIKEALQDKKWDIVVMQESNMDENMAVNNHTTDTWYLANYVKRTLGYTPKFMWNLTWSNPRVLDYDNQVTYDVDDASKNEEWLYNGAGITPEYWETTMKGLFGDKPEDQPQIQHNKMVKYVDNHILYNYGIESEDNVVATGTAVMKALADTSFKDGDTIMTYDQIEQFMYRDYTHLSDKGSLVAAYLWYAKLFDVKSDDLNAVNYDEIPAELRQETNVTVSISDEEKGLILRAVKATLSGGMYSEYTVN